jgi:hypothetical protein
MSVSPERVAERVDELIESIRQGASQAFAHDNASQSIGYIRQVHELGIIDSDQFNLLVAAVVLAAKSWESKRDDNGVPLTAGAEFPVTGAKSDRPVKAEQGGG